MSALLAVAGLASAAWEFWRRRHPVVLAPVPRGIGVYRDGTLQNVVSPSEITVYQWNVGKLFTYGFLAFILVITCVATVGMGGSGVVMGFELFLGVLAGTWLASHFWVRLTLTRIWLPTQLGKARAILVPKRLLPLILPLSPAPSTRGSPPAPGDREQR